MFDAFRKHPGKATAAHADDLQALIVASREERAALSAMLTQIQLQAGKLAAAGKASQDAEACLPDIEARLAAVARRVEFVEEAVGRANVALDGAAVNLDGRLERLTTQVQVVEHVETRLDTLGSLAESIESRIQHAQGLASDVERSAAAGDRLMEELARVEARPRQAARAEADERLFANVHGKTAAIAAMLEDVRVKMETIGEHPTTIAGVLASFSELGGLVLEAQSTLGSRQARHVPFERRSRGVRGQRA